jgi:hypothetical protein
MEVKNKMATQWEKERERAMYGLGGHGWTGRICWFIGIIFVIIGVVSEVTNTMIVLSPMSWYLLSIFVTISGAANIIAWAAGVIIWALEGKGKK